MPLQAIELELCSEGFTRFDWFLDYQPLGSKSDKVGVCLVGRNSISFEVESLNIAISKMEIAQFLE